MPFVKIAGLGHYLPKHCVTSLDLDDRLSLVPGTVEKKSGLIKRYFASDQETTSYMGAQAALKALHHAQCSMDDVDLIVSACGAPEQLIPATSVLIQKHLGLENSGVACFDINSTCLSFLTALDTVSYLLAGGRYKRALIVASDIPSSCLNWHDLDSCTIFGDGAAACVLEVSEGPHRIVSALMETYSLGSDYCRLEAGGTRIPPSRPFEHDTYGLFHMDGKKVFKLASHALPRLHNRLFQQAALTLDDVDWVVPHQASLLALHHLCKRLNIPETKTVDIFATHGNQMAASIPTALARLEQSGKLKRGQMIYLIGTGAGLSLAGMILEY